MTSRQASLRALFRRYASYVETRARARREPVPSPAVALADAWGLVAKRLPGDASEGCSEALAAPLEAVLFQWASLAREQRFDAGELADELLQGELALAWPDGPPEFGTLVSRMAAICRFIADADLRAGKSKLDCACLKQALSSALVCWARIAEESGVDWQGLVAARKRRARSPSSSRL